MNKLEKCSAISSVLFFVILIFEPIFILVSVDNGIRGVLLFILIVDYFVNLIILKSIDGVIEYITETNKCKEEDKEKENNEVD